METRDAMVDGPTLFTHFPKAAAALSTSGLLVPRGRADVVVMMDDHEDSPAPLVPGPDAGAAGYIDKLGRWQAVSEKELRRYSVDQDRLFERLLVRATRLRPRAKAPLIDGLLWDLGLVKLLRSKGSAEIWFARRLADQRTWERVCRYIESRPAPDFRVLLTSTRADRLPASRHNRHEIVSVHDVREAEAQLAISMDILAARFRPSLGERRYPIDHAPDYGVVWVGDKEYVFRGSKHRQILSMLFDAYWAGQPVLRTSDVLRSGDHVDRDTKVNTLRKAFSGRSDWRDFIRESDGNCWIEI